MTALALVPEVAEVVAPRNAFKRGEARLTTPGPNAYFSPLSHLDEAIATLRDAIAGERLHDTVIPDLQALSMDPRDGALTRGNGGMGYTDWAYGQLVEAFGAETKSGPFKGDSAPSSTVKAELWHGPAARSACFADTKSRSTRAAGVKGAALARTFHDANTGLRALRAVVTSVHSAEHFDDLAVLETIEALAPEGTRARFSRGWKFTYGNVILPRAGDVAVGYSFRNSEVGAASIGMAGSIHIEALDSQVVFPTGERYNVHVQIANRKDATRRNHTLPRVNRTEAERRAIAKSRLAVDIAKALTASEALAAGWARALVDSFPVDAEFALLILSDLLLERGVALGAVKQILAVIKDDTRLAALPRGSAAHLAGAVAIAAGKSPTYEEALELQELAGAIILDGWKFRV